MDSQSSSPQLRMIGGLLVRVMIAPLLLLGLIGLMMCCAASSVSARSPVDVAEVDLNEGDEDKTYRNESLVSRTLRACAFWIPALFVGLGLTVMTLMEFLIGPEMRSRQSPPVVQQE